MSEKKEYIERGALIAKFESLKEGANLRDTLYLCGVQAVIENFPTAPVWTPCDKGLPDYGVKCNVTVSVDMGDGASDVFVPTFAMHHNGVDWYDEDGYDYSHFKVLAWQPLSKPYNPDQFRDPTQKADHIVDPNKMVQEA